MRFRHLFIHSYGFTLKWERVKQLIEDLPQTTQDFQKETEKFIGFLNNLAKEIESE